MHNFGKDKYFFQSKNQEKKFKLGYIIKQPGNFENQYLLKRIITVRSSIMIK